METVLVRFKYYQLTRAEKGVIRRYIEAEFEPFPSALILLFSLAGQLILTRSFNLRPRFSVQKSTLTTG